MSRLVVIDGNSILNRAFYGIMGSKMLMTSDGKYTNAVYGFLAIMFKILYDLKPEYLAVAFDVKTITERHKLYEGYKATRKGMPNELAEQMPILKNILKAMNITILEKEGVEADDVLGTLSKKAEKLGMDVTILSGDRDTFQLASDKVTIQIPRTKVGKTENENYNRAKVVEVYGIEPKQLIEVKGLMGDASDNIPGVPGIGEKTALKLIQEYKTIDNLYKKIENNTADVKGKTKEKLIENKDLAIMSRTLGTINTEVKIDEKIEEMKVLKWDEPKVLEIFKELNFNRFIERFNLSSKEEEKNIKELFNIKDVKSKDIYVLIDKIKQEEKLIYYLGRKDSNDIEKIIKKEITNIAIITEKTNEIYFVNLKSLNSIHFLKQIFEDDKICKIGYKLKEDYILLKQLGINPKNLMYDIEIAAYLLNSTIGKYPIDELSHQYLGIDINNYLENNFGMSANIENRQINLFENNDNLELEEKNRISMYAYVIKELQKITLQKLEEIHCIELFENIEMPLVEVLAQMQYDGIYIDKKALIKYGEGIRKQIDELTQQIYDLAGQEFNINSTKQLGEILFEKLNLPVYKKNKTGYSTDVDVLEKLKKEHPVIEKILEYRSLMKLNSTYVEGMLPFINPQTNRIHSNFHQTITATGRISSTEPNLQNIPTRIELGKKLRRVFKPCENHVFVDADYSQIELRVLAHISEDEHMIEAFNNNEDIHKQVASKVFEIPIEQVTKTQRTEAKAVNFGIVYGISDFGLSTQIDVPKKKAKQYIEQYLKKYNGIKNFMDNIVEETKKLGYVETLFKRRRYIPEINSNNYIVRKFGDRAAMNTPIQGTAADIMKIAMINVYKELQKRNLKSKIVLQIHDELLIETDVKEKEEVKNILKTCMENAITLKVPLIVDLCEAKNWYEAK